MRACGGRENRRERALRIFHLVRERATVALLSPLVFYAGGVAVVRSFYKSGRRELVSFLLLLRPKAPASCSLSCRGLLHFAPQKPHLFFAAMAGDDVWPPSNVTRSALHARVKAGILRPITDARQPEWIVPSANDREPNPPPGYVVCFLSFLDRGFGTPASRLMRAILHYYEVELHNLSPNSVMQAAVFATVCEGFLGFLPTGTSGFIFSRRIWPPATREGRNFPCGLVVARCNFTSSGQASTSGASCPRRTGGGRAGGSTPRTTAGYFRNTLGRW